MRKYPIGVVISQILAFVSLVYIENLLFAYNRILGSYTIAIIYIPINSFIFIYPDTFVPVGSKMSSFFIPVKTPTVKTVLQNCVKAYTFTLLTGIPLYGILNQVINWYINTFLNGGWPSSPN